MALAEGTNKIQYTVSVATATFDFPYKYWESSDLNVSVVDLTSGAETTLDINAGDFTVSATNGDPALGATITTLISYDDHRVTLERIIAVESEADFVRGDGLPPDALNSEFDKAAARTQQLDDDIGRQLVHPVSDPAGLSYEAPTTISRANKVAGWDTSGNVIAVDLAESGTIGVDVDKGLAINSNIIECKTDGTSVAFDGIGQIEVIDSGISTAKVADDAVTFAKMQEIGDYKVIGNVSGATANPVEIAVIDDDTMATATATNIPTAESVKAYVDNGYSPVAYTGQESVTLPNGMIMKSGLYATSGDGSKTITYATPFPTGLVYVNAIGVPSVSDNFDLTLLGTPSLTAMTITIFNSEALTGIYWQATGY